MRLATLFLLAAAPAAADVYERQPRVLELFADTLRGAPAGPAGAGSAERILEGTDSFGRRCTATIDLREPAVKRGAVERGWPRESKLLVVQVAVGPGVPAYAAAVLFPPAAERVSSHGVRPVLTELSASEVVHEEADALITRRTRLGFSGGRLTEFRQLIAERGTGRQATVDCLGLRQL